MAKRRLTIWEQATRWPGDFCGRCADEKRRQRKVKTILGWQACPRCDNAEPTKVAA